MSIEKIRALDFGAIRQDSDDLEWWIANVEFFRFGG